MLRAKEFLESYQKEISDEFKKFIKKSIEVQNKRERKKRIVLGGVIATLVVIIGVVGYFGFEADEAKKNANNTLQDNIIQQGLIYKNYLNEPIKAKLIFANAIAQSTTKKREKQPKILYNSVNRGVKLKNIFGHNESVKGVIYSKNENEILSLNGDKTVRVWDKKSGKELLVLKHNDHVWGAKFSKDENKILSWSRDKTVKLWDKKSGKELLVLKHNDVVWGAKFSKDEKEIISWTKDGVVKTYKLYRDRKLKKEYYPLEAEVESGATLTKSGEVRALSKKEWEEKRGKLGRVKNE